MNISALWTVALRPGERGGGEDEGAKRERSGVER